MRDPSDVDLGVALVGRKQTQRVCQVFLERERRHPELGLDHLLGQLVHGDSETRGNERKESVRLLVLEAKREGPAAALRSHLHMMDGMMSQVNYDAIQIAMERPKPGLHSAALVGAVPSPSVLCPRRRRRRCALAYAASRSARTSARTYPPAV